MNRALGIDHGDARIGLAISDELGMLAHPLETIKVSETEPVGRIAQIVAEKSVGTIVLGFPKNMDGTTGAAAEKARAFADQLRALLPACQVKLWDERLTTVAAQKSLQAAGRNAKQSRAVIDQAAAQLILQGWLDSQSMGM
jgi:putative holliday junction resolvase